MARAICKCECQRVHKRKWELYLDDLCIKQWLTRLAASLTPSTKAGIMTHTQTLTLSAGSATRHGTEHWSLTTTVGTLVAQGSRTDTLPEQDPEVFVPEDRVSSISYCVNRFVLGRKMLSSPSASEHFKKNSSSFHLPIFSLSFIPRFFFRSGFVQ